MTDESKLYIKVGLFVGGALAILALIIFFISEEQNLFLKMNTYTIQFVNVEGLDVGNPVKLNGVKVGRIGEIRLPTEPKETSITVEILINKKYAGLIRSDSRARIRSLGLLGDKYIEINSGRPEASNILPGGQIPSTEATDIAKLLRRGEDTMDNLLAISTSLRDILDKISKGDSPLTDVVAKTNNNLDRLDRILTRVEEGEGTLGRFLSDDAMAEEIFGNLQVASDNLRKISTVMADDLGRDDSVWAHLTRDGEAGDRAADLLGNLSELSATLAEISDKLKAREDALLPKLLNDEEFAREVLQDIKETASRLKAISRKLDEGEGSAAMLINDPSIYDGIENVLYGLNKSRFLKWLIRHERKKGEKAREP